MEFISLKDAMKLTGKSESTFRNLARKLKESKSKNIKLEKKNFFKKLIFGSGIANFNFKSCHLRTDNFFKIFFNQK